MVKIIIKAMEDEINVRKLSYPHISVWTCVKRHP